MQLRMGKHSVTALKQVFCHLIAVVIILVHKNFLIPTIPIHVSFFMHFPLDNSAHNMQVSFFTAHFLQKKLNTLIPTVCDHLHHC